jgi:murein peptide amidase A
MGRAEPIRHSRSHDYGHLVRRWRSAAKSHGLQLVPYASASGFELYYAITRRPVAGRPWVYLSAGIHGDESASTEACLKWLTSASHSQNDLNLMIFPCLNPWGLVNNRRTDAEGRDLNRTYHDDAVPQTAAHKAALTGRRFDVALALHEDFDATGVYIYETRGKRPHWAEKLLAAASRHLPVDLRRAIEGRSSKAGIMRRKITPDMMPDHPEAFVLFFHHTERPFTLETPSEAHIDARVAAHTAMISCAVQLCLEEHQG